MLFRGIYKYDLVRRIGCDIIAKKRIIFSVDIDQKHKRRALESFLEKSPSIFVRKSKKEFCTAILLAMLLPSVLPCENAFRVSRVRASSRLQSQVSRQGKELACCERPFCPARALPARQVRFKSNRGKFSRASVWQGSDETCGEPNSQAV